MGRPSAADLCGTRSWRDGATPGNLSLVAHGRVGTLEAWLGEEQAAGYRSRRQRGTRLPFTWDHGDYRLYGLAIILLCVAIPSALVLFAQGGAWQVAAGVVIIVLLVGSVVAAVRYVRLPVDDAYRTDRHQRT
jgi:hypothetical protein